MSRLTLGRLLGQLPLGWLGAIRPGSPGERYLTHEKIRASLGYFGNQVRFLPWIDGTVVDETTEMRESYRLMLREPAIKASFFKKVLSVAQLDLQVHPASDAPMDKEVADFVHDALAGCRGGTRRIVYAILAGAMMDGYSVSEKVWQLQDRGRWKGKITLKALKAKDTQWVDLIGDTYRNVTHVRDLRTSYSYAVDNFVVYSHLPLFESPLGMSDFRAAYRAFWIMDTAWKLRSIALERYSLPFFKGTYTDNSTRTALEEMLQQARGQGWVTFPKGADLQVVDLATKSAGDYEAAIRDLTAEMVLAIEGATLQTLQGTVANGRGNSQVHQDSAQLLTGFLAAEAGDAISDQLVPSLVDMNYPAAAYPKVTLSSVDDQGLLASLQVDEGLQKLGVALSQKEMYQKYSRQRPSDDSDVLKPPAPPAPEGQDAPGQPASSAQPQRGQLVRFADWDESKHPRGEHGRWTNKPDEETSSPTEKAAAGMRAHPRFTPREQLVRELEAQLETKEDELATLQKPGADFNRKQELTQQIEELRSRLANLGATPLPGRRPNLTTGAAASQEAANKRSPAGDTSPPLLTPTEKLKQGLKLELQKLKQIDQSQLNPVGKKFLQRYIEELEQNIKLIEHGDMRLTEQNLLRGRTRRGEAIVHQLERGELEHAAIAKMGTPERLREVLNRVIGNEKYRSMLGDEMIQRLRELADPANVGMMMTIAGVAAATQGTPAAPVIDVLLLALFGGQVKDISGDVYNAILDMSTAQSGADLDQAAEHLARGLSKAAEAAGFYAAGKAAGRIKKLPKVAKVLDDLKLKLARGTRLLTGGTEWVPHEPELAKKELAKLLGDYRKLNPEGKVETLPRPPGVTRDAAIDVATGNIIVYDDVPPAFRDGFLAEELHHYFQLKERNLIGKPSLSAKQSRELEADVTQRMRASGFKPYDARDYEPYTNVPRPPGVHGGDKR